MINRSFGPLYDKLQLAHQQLNQAQTPDEKIALANYIGNLYCSLICMGEDVKIDKKKCFGGDHHYHKFVKRLDVYNKEMLHHFVLCKDFHQSFMGEVLPSVEESLQQICPMKFPKEEEFSYRDFMEYFYFFLESYGLEEYFETFLKDRHVHSVFVGQEKENLGFTLYNPISSDVDFFIRDFQPNLSSMITLAHEFGHGIDLKNFHGNVEEYNRYFYQSFFGEVFSRLMDRLFFRFCLKNGIQEGAVRDKMVDFEILNHEFLLQSYVLSLLDDSFLLNEGYLTCDRKVIVEKVKRHFMNENVIADFLNPMSKLDLQESFNYAYGDILSMFLAEEVERNGFFREMMEYFMQWRSEIFQEDFLRECGFGPKNYQKLYQKEMNLIKK